MRTERDIKDRVRVWVRVKVRVRVRVEVTVRVRVRVRVRGENKWWPVPLQLRSASIGERTKVIEKKKQDEKC